MRNTALRETSIERCTNAVAARLVLACIERRIADLRMTFAQVRREWPALLESWQRDRDAVVKLMTRKGWL